MYLIKYIMFCLVIAFTMASLFKKKFEESIITVQLGIIAFLYLFYVFDILNFGFYVMCFIITLAFFYAIYKMIKLRKADDVIRLAFRPATFIYFGLLLLIYLTIKGNTVCLIDELHLWGALPKILYYHEGKLQLKESMMLGFTDYIPGMPLYLYFLEHMTGQFKEALLYFGYAALGAAMLLPMCKNMSSCKKWYTFPIIIGILYLTPLTFYNAIFSDYAVYYNSLHIDALVGITTGYSVWLFTQMPWKSIFHTINFSLCLTFLVLLKSSGIVFVGILLIIILFYLLKYNKIVLKRYYFGIGLAFPLAMYILWRVCLLFWGASDTIEYAIGDIFRFEYVKEFFSLLVSTSILQPRNAALTKYCTFISILLWMALLCTSWYCIVKKQRNQTIKIIKWGFGILLVQMIIFIAGLYGLCVGPFGSSTPSYPRYICTILTAIWCFFIMNFVYTIKTFTANTKRRDTFCKIFYIVFGISVLILIYFYPLYLPGRIYYSRTALNDADHIDRIISDALGANSSSSTPKKATLIIDRAYNSSSPDLSLYLHRRLYFNLIDENIYLNYVRVFDNEIASETTDSDMKIVSLFPEQKWVDCDYVYQIYYINDSFKRMEIYNVKAIDGNMIYLQSMGSKNIE